MPHAYNLMGLGMAPPLALAIATQGTQQVTAAGSTYATSAKLRNNKCAVVSNSDGTVAVGLPPIGGDTGAAAMLADMYVICNTGTTSLQLFASSGITISVNGSSNSQQPIQSFTTMIVWPVSTTQWIGMKGAA